MLKPKAALTADEKKEMASLEALHKLTAGFQCEAALLEPDDAGEWTKKTPISEATTKIESSIDADSTTYGYHGGD